MDNLTKEQRSYNMSRIRSSNTKLELKFFKLLKENRIQFTKHPKISGKPDCLIGKNLLVFIDSDFWHGWHFKQWGERLPKNYWREKIQKNIKRDKLKFRRLKKEGYKVLRIWSHSLKDEGKIVTKVASSVKQTNT
mgnify:CR=1 FL=1